MSWRERFFGSSKGGPATAARPASGTASVGSAPPTVTALFGKLPTRRDFVRIGGSFPGFERWLEEGLEGTAVRGGPLPAAPLRFLLPGLGTPAGATNATAAPIDLVGILVPSRDLVGREFPLALVRTLPCGPAASLAQSWQANEGFFAAAAALLADPAALAALDEAGLAALAATAPASPDADPLAASARESLAAIFGPLDEGGPVYALATLLEACQAAGTGGRPGPTLTVEAPAPDAAMLAFSLSLAGRRLAWPAARPAALAGEGRLVLGLAAAPASAAVYLGHRLGKKAGPRHWSVLAEDAAAKEKALTRLAPPLAALLAGEGSLAALIDLVVGSAVGLAGDGATSPADPPKPAAN